MSKSFFIRLCAAGALMSCLLTGCGNAADSEAETSSAAESSASTETSAAAATIEESAEASASTEATSSEASETAEAETKTLTISIVNTCGVDIGMVAVIDPATNEQVNLDSLSDEESISMEATWPVSVSEFQWALYNTDGELCIESKTDISSASSSVTLILTGDGDLEDVEEVFE